jgi:hypothetical protein
MTMTPATSYGGTMEVDAFLADSAEAVQGKIYGLGIGWNNIYVPTFPAVHPRVSVGITIHVPYTHTNQMHTIALHLEGADGERLPLGETPPEQLDGETGQILEIGGTFNVGRPPLLPAGDEQVVPLAMTINGLRLERPDMLTWVISIDGTPVKRLPMRVHQLLQQQAVQVP